MFGIFVGVIVNVCDVSLLKASWDDLGWSSLLSSHIKSMSIAHFCWDDFDIFHSFCRSRGWSYYIFLMSYKLSHVFISTMFFFWFSFQVYKAKTREGQQIALKVMRPGVARLVACDWVCWFLALKLQRLQLGLYGLWGWWQTRGAWFEVRWCGKTMLET